MEKLKMGKNRYIIIQAVLKRASMFLLYHFRPRWTKSVYFSAFTGQYSDSPKAISEELHRLAPELNIVWVMKDVNKSYVPDYVKAVKPHSLKAIIAQAHANAWVLNGAYSKNDGIYKGRRTYYVQTWHGDRGFKRVGYWALEKMKGRYSGINNLPYMHDCDLFVVGSEYGRKKAREAFLYGGDIIDVGMPRNDKLVCAHKYESEIHKIRNRLGIKDDERVVLYAPTFRDNSRNSQRCLIDVQETLEHLESNGEKWRCLVRSHSRLKGVLSSQQKESYLDVTWYPDMADLLLVADLLLTDYSSSAGDFILTNRPVVVLLLDVEEYERDSRALLVDPKRAGFLVAENQKELNNILSNLNQYDFVSMTRRIRDFYGTNESGHSAVEVALMISNKLKQK